MPTIIEIDVLVKGTFANCVSFHPDNVKGYIRFSYEHCICLQFSIRQKAPCPGKNFV